MGIIDLTQDAPARGQLAPGWALLEGYGDNGAVMFCANQAEAADVARAPRWAGSAPIAGDRAWLRLNPPFAFDSIAPFWCLYQPPQLQPHGPSPDGDELSRLALVRCRLARAPAHADGEAAVARVAVLETRTLGDLARGPFSGAADAAVIRRLRDGPGALPPLRQGAYSVLTRDVDGVAGEWAIVHHDVGAVDLLVHGAWDIDSDRMWAGRARLPQSSIS